MALACEISPLSAFLSTNLNNQIETYDRLGDRIKRALGWPLISLEIHTDQLRENIQISSEYFTKFAGYTREFLIFDSSMYETNKGIRLDFLYTLANTNMDSYAKKTTGTNPSGPGASWYGEAPDSVFVATSTLSAAIFKKAISFATQPTLSASVSGSFLNGIQAGEIIDQTTYSAITSLSSNPGGSGMGIGEANYGTSLSGNFTPTIKHTYTIQGSASDIEVFQNVFDYDIMEYRKVVDVVDFEEGSTTGINTLFTLEQTLAQQTYFSYAMGNYGFDLLSWYTMKEFLDMREKVLATHRDISFDPRTQYLKMYPQPGREKFYGVLACYLEKPLRDIVKEQWVYEYSLALSMITVGRVRGKFGQVNLLGGGSLNADILQEGLTRKAELEQKLLEGSSPGFGDTEPPMFFMG